jgi:hypothetical protein
VKLKRLNRLPVQWLSSQEERTQQQELFSGRKIDAADDAGHRAFYTLLKRALLRG